MCERVILVVEDEILIRMLIAEDLRDAGYHVIEAVNADEGMLMLHSGQPIDLIVTDVRMPGEIDGMELVARAKGLNPDLAVVLMSGHLPTDVVHRADAFLRKPYITSDLLSIILKLVGPSCQIKIQNRTAS